MGTDTYTGSTSLKNGDGHTHTGSTSLKNGDGHSHRVNQSEEWGTFDQVGHQVALVIEDRISGWNHSQFRISGKHSGI